MAFHLITDTHFCHKKIIEYCGRPLNYEDRLFKSMSQVPEEDVLIHLGDICIGQDQFVHEAYIQPLKCKKWLVMGNHDHKSQSWYLSHGWDWVGRSFTMTAAQKRVIFSHMPTVNHKDFDLNIHGHFHNSNHRSVEPQFQNSLTDKHLLLAVEYTNYQTTNLEKFIYERTNKT